MIPFGILSGKIFYSEKEDKIVNEKCIEIRVIELSANNFTLRLPKGFFCADSLKDITKITLNFYENAKNSYNEIDIAKHEMSINLCNSNDFYDCFDFGINNKNFSKEAMRLSREYLDYIEARLYYEDSERAAKYSNYPLNADDDFCENLASQLDLFLNDINKVIALIEENEQANNIVSNIIEKTDIGIALDNRKIIELFLENDIYSFSNIYFHGINHNIVKDKAVKYLYIGNQFCEELFQDNVRVLEVVDKACRENITPVIVFAPFSEEAFEKKLNKVFELLDEIEKKYEGLSFEIIVNDIGLLNILEEKKVYYKINYRVKKGILLNKHMKDSRFKYIRNISKNYNFDYGENEIYYPFYQMNTGTFCPLYAAITTGKRQNIKKSISCNRECERFGFIYPKHLKMLGIYNSLFGFNAEFITESELLSEMLKNKRDRVVFNLWIR